VADPPAGKTAGGWDHGDDWMAGSTLQFSCVSRYTLVCSRFTLVGMKFGFGSSAEKKRHSAH